MNCIAILGIGNPIVSDDGVGIYVVRELRKRIDDYRVACKEMSGGGFDILDHLKGADEALIIDAAKTGCMTIGQALLLPLSEFSLTPQFRHHSVAHPLSLHTLGLHATFEMGSLLGLPMPKHVTVFAIEVQDTETVHEGCTPEIAAAIPALTDNVIQFLRTRIPDVRYSESQFQEQPEYDTQGINIT
jgi:hydrogenase maturation protease